MKDQPKISIVTVSLNQGRFLEDAVRSVLDQGYPNLEYMIVDGGSSDESVDVIRRYEDRLAWWCSEPDGGQYDAVDKGLKKTSGEIMGWLNADDKHLPWTFSVVAGIFGAFPEIEWLTTLYPLVWNEAGNAVRCARRGPFSATEFFKGDALPGMEWHATGWIQQESTFWRRSLWERAGGGLDGSLEYAGDFDLWARFFKHAELYAAEVPLAGFRRHGKQKTGEAPEAYQKEALQVLLRHGGVPRSHLSSALSLAVKRICPGRMRPLAWRLGLITPGRVCSYDSEMNRWRVVEE